MGDDRRSWHCHAQARARERYGLSLSRAQIEELAEKCANGEGVLIRKPTPENPSKTVLVEVEGVALPVVFAPESSRVITILPRGYKLQGSPKQPHKMRIAVRQARRRRRIAARKEASHD